MSDTSARRRVPPATRVGIAALVALLLGGCAGGEEAAPEPEPTPITALETDRLQVPRIDFCELVPDAAVTAALGGEATAEAAYGNGDEVEVLGAGTDVVRELGCTWSGADGAVARAWVFAQPVTARFVRQAVRPGSRTEGCRVLDGPGFGRPSLTQECELPEGVQRVRHAGLFDQTWLSCEVEQTGTGAARSDVRARTDDWCVAVAGALDTTD